MKRIVVTITDTHERFACDSEVRAAAPGAQLTKDVMEALAESNPELCFNACSHCLYINRLNRVLSGQESLAQAGARNGDYITVLPRI